VFSENIQAFSAEMGAIDSSYRDSEQQIAAEQRLSNRIEWMRDRPLLAIGPGCASNATNATRCEIISAAPNSTAVAAANKADIGPNPAQPVAPPAEDVCGSGAGAAPPVRTGAAEAPAPLQPAQLLGTLENYTAALAAVTKAQDRAEFDNAAARVSAAVGRLVQTAPPPYSTAAPVAKASTNIVLWLVGEDLDYRRLHELQNATQIACEPIHELAAALGVVLTAERRTRLRGLHHLLALKIEAVNIARSKPQVTDQAYGAAIDDAEAVADAFQTVRATDPEAAAQALGDAHDALVIAVRNNDGEFAALVANLQTFSRRANDLAAAAAATASSANPSLTKSYEETRHEPDGHDRRYSPEP